MHSLWYENEVLNARFIVFWRRKFGFVRTYYSTSRSHTKGENESVRDQGKYSIGNEWLIWLRAISDHTAVCSDKEWLVTNL